MTDMELVEALNATEVPIARAVFLMISAVQDADAGDNKTWSCCHPDRSPAASPGSTTGWRSLRESPSGPAVIEVCYNDGADSFLTVKWVPMDKTHLVMITQRSDRERSHQPLNTSFCIEDEPLASLALGQQTGSGASAAAMWTAESLGSALHRLRCLLQSAIGNTGRGSEQNEKFSAAQDSDCGRELPSPRETQPRPLELHCGGPAPPPSPPVPSQGSLLFAGVVPRPPGARYGEADLIPGGGGFGMGGGMMLGREAFQGSHIVPARYNPMFPGDVPPRVRPPGRYGSTFPGEPDPDNFLPPGGPAFSSSFGPGRMNGFGGHFYR